MPIRAKSRPAPTRRGTAVTARRATAKRDARAKHAGSERHTHYAGRKHNHSHHHAPEKHASSNGVSSYSKAIRFLASLADFERLRIVRYNSTNFDLERMRTLLKRLGNPQDQFKSVHVAGTKGKGSTCAMIAAMLQACGYKVGLYTSPHLTDVRERIQVDGEPISRERFLDLVWGYAAFPTTRTVDNHIASLRAKIEKNPDDPKWIKTVHGIGYRLDFTKA